MRIAARRARTDVRGETGAARPGVQTARMIELGFSA
jgi:hypothetical protein